MLWWEGGVGGKGGRGGELCRAESVVVLSDRKSESL